MGQVKVPSQSFPAFQNMFPNPVTGQQNIHQTAPQLTSTDGISQVGISPPVSVPSTWGVTGTAVVPTCTSLPRAATQYLPPASQGH